MVEPMSPRLASAMTSSPAARPAASTSSNAAMPAEPHRSKKATCGFTTGTTPANASMHRSPKVRTPSADAGRPHSASSPTEGSMPAHSGPVSATARATRLANPSAPVKASELVTSPIVCTTPWSVCHHATPLIEPLSVFLDVRFNREPHLATRAPSPLRGPHTTGPSRRAPATGPVGPGRWPCRPGQRRPRPSPVRSHLRRTSLHRPR